MAYLPYFFALLRSMSDTVLLKPLRTKAVEKEEKSAAGRVANMIFCALSRGLHGFRSLNLREIPRFLVLQVTPRKGWLAGWPLSVKA